MSLDTQHALSVVRRRLKQIAREGRTIPYAEVASEIGWAPNGIGRPLLGQIAEEESAAGRSLLTAVVVRSGRRGLPGDGFFTLAQSLGHCLGARSPEDCWRDELEKTYAYWSKRGFDGSAELHEQDHLDGEQLGELVT